MKIRLYPISLRTLGLDFAEAIYAIVFGLEEEILDKGKETIFNDLHISPEEMAINVEKLLSKLPKGYDHSLRRVFGDLESNLDREVSVWDPSARAHRLNLSLETQFDYACQYLVEHALDLRPILLDGQWTPREGFTQVGPDAGDDDPRAQIEQLTLEMQLLAKRCEEIMKELTRLNGKVGGRVTAGPQSPETITMFEIRWPYRSAGVLKELGFEKLDEIVAYFGDAHHYFDEATKREKLTLLEWAAITTVLRKEKLLPQREEYDSDNGYTVKLDCDVVRLDFSTRTCNTLKWRTYGALDVCTEKGHYFFVRNMREFMYLFADGVDEGMCRLHKIGGIGKKSASEIIEKLSDLDFELEESFCYPTLDSPVAALDFDAADIERLKILGIATVRQLCAACADKSHFTGLRYVWDTLYQSAIEHLKKYGFNGI